MTIQGPLRKMLSEYQTPIRYFLNFKDGFVDMNQMMGKNIEITHTGNLCSGCGLNKPIFRMGFCSSCFYTVPQASPSIINPELSQAHLGKADRDLEWEKKFQLQPHVVYLALSGGLKVGVTRETQIPYRWIDQGASQAVIFAKTENRYQAGMLEVLLKNNLPDKTNWQRMLRNENPDIDLQKTKWEVKSVLNDEQALMCVTDDMIWDFQYPVEEYPVKVKSLNLIKQPIFSGKLCGIRGQYLYLENGLVFNVRNHEGFVVKIKLE